MKILWDTEKIKKRVKEMVIGDVFADGNELYMVTNNTGFDGCVECVCLNNGYISYKSNHHSYEVKDVELKVL